MLSGLGSCGIITTYSNVDLQVTRLPTVLLCGHSKSCRGEVAETCSPSSAWFHKVEASSSWYVRGIEEKRGGLLLSWQPPRCLRFPSCASCIWLQIPVFAVFPVPSFWLREGITIGGDVMLLPTFRGVMNLFLLWLNFSESVPKFWPSKALMLGTSTLYFWRLWKWRIGEAHCLSTWSRARSVER